MASTVEIKGLKELDAVLKSLPEKIEQNVMRGAIRAGQKIMIDAVREKLRTNQSIKSGALEKSLRIRFDRKAKKRGWLNAKVIAGDKEAYYAHMVEFGTASHLIGVKKRKTLAIQMVGPSTKGSNAKFIGTKVNHPGARPKPFMRPAFDESQQAAIEAFAEYVRKRLPRELKKAGRV